MKRTLRKTADWFNRKKFYLDQELDPLLLYMVANSSLAYGTYKAVDHFPYTTPNKALGMALTLAAAGTGAALANKYVISPIAKKIRNHNIRKIKTRARATKGSWIRTAAQLLVPALGITYYPAIDQWGKKEIPLEERLEETTSRTPVGAFSRTYRWEEIFVEMEERYDIEQDLLQGITMHESQGNPIAVGPTGDVGLMQFIPRTAVAYGLKVYENTDNLRGHTNTMNQLVRSHNYNYEALTKIDDRFSGEKSIEAAARFLRDMHNRYGSWDQAVSAYNQGQPAIFPGSTSYVRGVREKQKVYREFREAVSRR